MTELLSASEAEFSLHVTEIQTKPPQTEVPRLGNVPSQGPKAPQTPCPPSPVFKPLLPDKLRGDAHAGGPCKAFFLGNLRFWSKRTSGGGHRVLGEEAILCEWVENRISNSVLISHAGSPAPRGQLLPLPTGWTCSGSPTRKESLLGQAGVRLRTIPWRRPRETLRSAAQGSLRSRIPVRVPQSPFPMTSLWASPGHPSPVQSHLSSRQDSRSSSNVPSLSTPGNARETCQSTNSKTESPPGGHL